MLGNINISISLMRNRKGPLGHIYGASSPISFLGLLWYLFYLHPSTLRCPTSFIPSYFKNVKGSLLITKVFVLVVVFIRVRFKHKKKIGGSSSSSLEMYINQQVRTQTSNNQLSRSGTSSPTQPKPPHTPTRCSSVENLPKNLCLSVDLNDDGKLQIFLFTCYIFPWKYRERNILIMKKLELYSIAWQLATISYITLLLMIWHVHICAIYWDDYDHSFTVPFGLSLLLWWGSQFEWFGW